MSSVGALPRELVDALPFCAGDPHRFIDAREFAQFHRYPPATREQIERVEDRVGFPLPEALRIIYLEVGNGGFGPGYGILGVDDGATDDLGGNVEQVYENLSAPDAEVRDWEWREHALPFCYWGCQVYSCVMPDGSVVDLDGYDWGEDHIPVAEWLSRWAHGQEPRPTREEKT